MTPTQAQRLARIANDLEDASITAGPARGLAVTSGLVAQQQAQPGGS